MIAVLGLMSRRLDIDIIRILSSFGIIWFHTGIFGHQISYSALICYLIISGYLAGYDNSLSFRNHFKIRFKRLIVPWAFWFIFYGAFNLAKGERFLPENYNFFIGVLHGTSIHLWYIPFIFLFLVIFDFSKMFLSRSQMSLFSACFSVLYLSLLPFWREFSLELGYPYAQYVHAIPGFFIGIFFQLYSSIKNILSRFLFFSLLLISISLAFYGDFGFAYFFGIIVSSALMLKERLKFLNSFLIKKITATNYLVATSSASFGVYFCHVFIISISKNIFHINGIFLPIIVFIASYLVILTSIKLMPKYSFIMS